MTFKTQKFVYRFMLLNLQRRRRREREREREKWGKREIWRERNWDKRKKERTLEK